MYRFQISIHARAAEVTAGGKSLRAAAGLPALSVPSTALSATFSRSFEDVSEALADLPRLYIEPDGSFVWVSSDPNESWQVDGVLYDRDGRLLFVELKGSCPPEQFDQILTTCGWPAAPVMIQLTQLAAFVDEAAFRQWAAPQ